MKSHASIASRRNESIHILDDDSLLNIFSHCRRFALDGREFDDFYIFQWRVWSSERWWYKLVQVCRRWRYLILGSTFHLRLGLLCTNGTPVADMLTHAPPLPLVIDRFHHNTITARDKDNILLALQHRDRVRHIRLQMPVSDLQSLIVAMDGEFPMLEYLAIAPPTTGTFYTNLVLPAKFQALRLRRLMLLNTTFPVGFPSLTTPSSVLETLSLKWLRLSTFLQPGDLLERLSFLPQLERLQISFDTSVYDIYGGINISLASTMTQISFPNLRQFIFQGPGEYLEALVPWVEMPLLEKLDIVCFYQHTSLVPQLLPLLSTTESFRFTGTTLTFSDMFISVNAHSRRGVRGHFSYLHSYRGAFDQQVSSAAQMFDSLGAVFNAVEHLDLEYQRGRIPLERDPEVDRTQWRKLLQSFRNVKTLLVDDGPTGELSRSLPLDHGESGMDLLPELKKISYSTYDDGVGSFTAFAAARKNAGHPVTLVRRCPHRVRD